MPVERPCAARQSLPASRRRLDYAAQRPVGVPQDFTEVIGAGLGGDRLPEANPRYRS
jgi:hypothetical protein